MGAEKPIAPSTMAPKQSHESTKQEQTSSSSDNSKHDGGKTREVRQPFPCKVYDMLEDADEKGFADIVSWNKEGTGFTVHSKERFTKDIVPKYFNQTRYKSFQRQLSLYGFERATSGTIKGLRYHDNLRRGYSHLCRQMKPIGYKPRGQEKLQEMKQDAETSRSRSVSPPMEKTASQQDTGSDHQAMPSLPTVISSESIHKENLQATPPLVPTPNDGFVLPPSLRACSRITERLVTTDSIAVFEGMPFFLMMTLPPKTQHNAPNAPAPLAPPATLVTGDGGVEGQMKKAWDIGFAVASTMKPFSSGAALVNAMESNIYDL
jgi:hypothetical protein